MIALQFRYCIGNLTFVDNPMVLKKSTRWAMKRTRWGVGGAKSSFNHSYISSINAGNKPIHVILRRWRNDFFMMPCIIVLLLYPSILAILSKNKFETFYTYIKSVVKINISWEKSGKGNIIFSNLPSWSARITYFWMMWNLCFDSARTIYKTKRH